MKIKILSDRFSTVVVDKVNEFIKDKRVLDIKLQISNSGWTYVMVIYKDEN